MRDYADIARKLRTKAIAGGTTPEESRLLLEKAHNLETKYKLGKQYPQHHKPSGPVFFGFHIYMPVEVFKNFYTQPRGWVNRPDAQNLIAEEWQTDDFAENEEW